MAYDDCYLSLGLSMLALVVIYCMYAKENMMNLPEPTPELRNDKLSFQRKPQGWWQDVVDCVGGAGLYCKPREAWIWPY